MGGGTGLGKSGRACRHLFQISLVLFMRLQEQAVGSHCVCTCVCVGGVTVGMFNTLPASSDMQILCGGKNGRDPHFNGTPPMGYFSLPSPRVLQMVIQNSHVRHTLVFLFHVGIKQAVRIAFCFVHIKSKLPHRCDPVVPSLFLENYTYHVGSIISVCVYLVTSDGKKGQVSASLFIGDCSTVRYKVCS